MFQTCFTPIEDRRVYNVSVMFFGFEYHLTSKVIFKFVGYRYFLDGLLGNENL